MVNCCIPHSKDSSSSTGSYSYHDKCLNQSPEYFYIVCEVLAYFISSIVHGIKLSLATGMLQGHKYIDYSTFAIKGPEEILSSCFKNDLDIERFLKDYIMSSSQNCD